MYHCTHFRMQIDNIMDQSIHSNLFDDASDDDM